MKALVSSLRLNSVTPSRRKMKRAQASPEGPGDLGNPSAPETRLVPDPPSAQTAPQFLAIPLIPALPWDPHLRLVRGVQALPESLFFPGGRSRRGCLWVLECNGTAII